MMNDPQPYEAERYVNTGQKLAGVMLIVPALGVSLIGLVLVAAGMIGAGEVILQSKVEPFFSKGIFGGLPATLIVCLAGLAVIALSSAMMMIGQIIAGRKRRVKPGQLVWLVVYIAARDVLGVLWLMMFVGGLMCGLSGLWIGMLCMVLVLGTTWFGMIACNRRMVSIENIPPPSFHGGVSQH